MTSRPQQTRATLLAYCAGRPASGLSHEYCLNYHMLSDLLTINMLSLCVGRQRELPPRCRICSLKRRKDFNPCLQHVLHKERTAADSRAITRSTMDRKLKILQSKCEVISRIASCKRVSGPGEIPFPQVSTIVSASSSVGDTLTPKQCEASVEMDSVEFGAFGQSETQWDSDGKSNKVEVRRDEKRGDKGDDVNGQEETDHAPSQSSNSERQMPSTEILCILRHAHPDVALEMPPLPMQNANFQRYLVQCNHESLLDMFQDRLRHGRIAEENSEQIVSHNGTELYRIVTVENVARSNFRSKLFYAASAA
eukprot:jgi/Picsp_1/406/NSC_00404-R1_---NA---